MNVSAFPFLPFFIVAVLFVCGCRNRRRGTLLLSTATFGENDGETDGQDTTDLNSPVTAHATEPIELVTVKDLEQQKTEPSDPITYISSAGHGTIVSKHPDPKDLTQETQLLDVEPIEVQKMEPIGKQAYKLFYHLLVIGCGAHGVATAAQLVEELIEPPLKLGFVEKKPECGPGLPYDKNVVKPEHLLHVFRPQYVAITGWADDFERWINGSEYRQVLDDYYDGKTSSTTPKRIMIGKYLKDSFKDFVDDFVQRKSYNVTIMTNTTAVNIEPHPSGDGYIVKLKTKTKEFFVRARDIVLATGHWFRKRYDNHKGYYESPWPADRLRDEIPEEEVGVLGGGGLSGADTIVTLSHRFGKFSKDNTKYETFSEKSNFRIKVYSRSGNFLAVQADGRNYYSDYEVEYLKLGKIEMELAFGNLSPFNAIFKLLKEEVALLMPDIKKNTNLDQMEPKDFFARMDNILNPTKNATEVFVKDIKGEGDPVRNELRVVFTALTDLFYDYKLLPKFSAEDVISFRQYIAPRIMRFMVRLPLTNAKKMLALMVAGRLSHQAIGTDYTIEKKSGGGVRLTFDGQTVDHDYFIEALAQSGRIAKDPRPLTQSLFKNNLTIPTRFVFKSKAYASRILKGVVSKDIDRSRIVQVGHDFYYEGDGVEMDRFDMTIIPAQRQTTRGLIYGSYPFVSGINPIAEHGLGSLVTMAETTVANIRREMEKTQQEISDSE